MTLAEQVVTVGVCVLGTMLSRFLPFLIFREKKPVPKYIQYIGKALPSAIFGMLVIYCLKNVFLLDGSRGIPEFIAIAVTSAIHLWRRNMLLSIAAGTACYMLLIQFIF